jgi:hypothetical protein
MSSYPITAASASTDVVERGLARRIDEYKKREKFGAWLASYLKGLQTIEAATWEVILERLLTDAVGVQLDMLGKIVGEPRWTSDDDEYRISIFARIAVNSSNGRYQDIETVAALVLRVGDTDAAFHPEEHFPATIFVVADEPIENDPNRAVLYLDKARGAGIRLQLIYPTQDLEKTFAFRHAGSSSDGDRGFGHAGSSDFGGKLSSVTEA